MKDRFFLILLIGILNYFFVFPKNLLLLLLSLLVSVFLLKDFLKKSNINTVFILIFLFVFSTVAVKAEFDKNLFTLGHLEAHKTVARHGYYVQEFGQLYSNRFGLFYSDSVRPLISKFTRNSFSHLEFNQYFIAKNPISVAFLVLFFFGFYIYLEKPNKLTIFYFVISFIVGGFLVDSSKFSVALLTPLINLFVCLGVFGFVSLIKNEKFKIK